MSHPAGTAVGSGVGHDDLRRSCSVDKGRREQKYDRSKYSPLRGTPQIALLMLIPAELGSVNQRLDEALLAMKDVKLITLVTDGNSSNWHLDFQAHSITSLRYMLSCAPMICMDPKNITAAKFCSKQMHGVIAEKSGTKKRLMASNGRSGNNIVEQL